MARFIAYVTLLFALITFVSAQTVGQVNTPMGPIQQGVNLTVTWSLTGTPTQPGMLQVINSDTQNTETISNSVDLNAKMLMWLVDVTPGTYHFALNDGTGAKLSGPFQVTAASGGSNPGPAAPGPAPGPAPGGPPPSTPPKSNPSPKANAPKGGSGSPGGPPPSGGPGGPGPNLVQGNATTSATPAAPSHSAGNFVSTISVYNLVLGLMSVVFVIHFA